MFIVLMIKCTGGTSQLLSELQSCEKQSTASVPGFQNKELNFGNQAFLKLANLSISYGPHISFIKLKKFRRHEPIIIIKFNELTQKFSFIVHRPWNPSNIYRYLLLKTQNKYRICNIL